MNTLQLAWVALLSLPVLEIYLLIQVGSVIGFLPTVILLFSAASLGGWLLQTQGGSIWLRVQQSVRNGELPAIEIMDGFVILAGGFLLLLPGFLSDLAGLACLLPATRKIITAWLMQRRMEQQGVRTHENGAIEGEYRRED